jgi:RNA polymerase-binding transcription factor DksA
MQEEESVVSGTGTSLSADVLRTRFGELALRVAQLETELRRPADDDGEEQAIDRENDETTEALERSALEEIAAIKAALGRIENGSYGRCMTCGEPIGLERLQLVPTATQCIACAGDTPDR